ncbi:MAG: ankyrin repeat domain-containing protein, partial [Akkermansia muciniphila]
NIEAQDEDGNTPLIEAACHGHKAVVHLLLEHGANSDATNREGYTAYDCAKKTSIRQILRSY